VKVWKDKDKSGKAVWRGDATIGGRRLRPVAATKKEIEDIFAAQKVAARAAKYNLSTEDFSDNLITVAELISSHKRSFSASKHHQAQKKILDDFLQSLPSPDMAVTDLSESHIASFVANQRRRGLKNTSVNFKISAVVNCLSSAPDYFIELKDYRPPRAKWLSIPRRGRERVMSKKEYETLLAHLRAERLPREQYFAVQTRHEVADMLEIAWNTAMRWKEIRTLEKGQIDFRDNLLRLTETKTGIPRAVPMNKRVRALLDERVKRIEKMNCRYVFPNPEGTAPRSTYHPTFRRAARLAGLDYGAVKNGFTPHATRHTATSEMLRRTGDFGAVRDIAGHSDKTMTLRYTHSHEENRRRAVESLESNDESSEAFRAGA
jgi:integrase